jgi:hypothetical protein
MNISVCIYNSNRLHLLMAAGFVSHASGDIKRRKPVAL